VFKLSGEHGLSRLAAFPEQQPRKRTQQSGQGNAFADSAYSCSLHNGIFDHGENPLLRPDSTR
ncbi:MAG: hypothetical protein V4588_00900, partial [Pseudomonadota bacterium]